MIDPNIAIGLIGTVAGVISLLLSMIRYKRMKLTCKYKIYPLYKYNAELAKAYKIEENANFIEDMNMIEVELKNSGNVDIASNAFEENISIVFPAPASIVVVSPMKNQEHDLLPTFSCGKNLITIKPILIKRNEKIRLQIFIKEFSERMELRTRIIGLKPVSLIVDNSKSEAFTMSDSSKIAVSEFTKKEKLQFLAERSSFWIAVVSILAFTIGNMAGQHIWQIFWYYILEK